MNKTNASYPFDIIFQNKELMIINKPAGIAAYSSKFNKSACIEDYFPLLTKQKNGPWLAHRLDQDTAGCLVIALKKQALVQAQTYFQQKRVIKIYWAIVQGKPNQSSGTIDIPISKCRKHNQWFMHPDPSGLPAITQWKLIGTNDDFSCLELRLKTGRTHQARVHCAALGHPIVDDRIYNQHPHHSNYHQLFNRYIALPFQTKIEATAEPPEHMRILLKKCNVAGFS